LIVIVLIVEALRAKHALGAGKEAPPDVMVAQVEQKTFRSMANGSARWTGT
jgi:hypothetical protein